MGDRRAQARLILHPRCVNREARARQLPQDQLLIVVVVLNEQHP